MVNIVFLITYLSNIGLSFLVDSQLLNRSKMLRNSNQNLTENYKIGKGFTKNIAKHFWGKTPQDGARRPVGPYTEGV